MRQLFIYLVRLYQTLDAGKRLVLLSVFGFESRCLYTPTCSHYMIRQLKEHGTIIGLFKGGKRIASCWGFNTHVPHQRGR